MLARSTLSGSGRFPWRRPSMGQGRRRRPRNTLNPSCDALDGRLLPSAVVVLPTPPAAEVAQAALTLTAASPGAFARLERAVATAASHSAVTQGQATVLAQDEAAIDQTIGAAGYEARVTRIVESSVQFIVDRAFRIVLPQMATTGAGTVTVAGHTFNRPNDSALAASARALLELLRHVPGGSQLVPGTVYQMGVVAQSVGLTPHLEELLSSNWGMLGNDVGSGDVGVYFAGQVNDFVKS